MTSNMGFPIPGCTFACNSVAIGLLMQAKSHPLCTYKCNLRRPYRIIGPLKVCEINVNFPSPECTFACNCAAILYF